MPRVEVTPAGDQTPGAESACSHDDAITEATGAFGRWQLRLTFLLSLFNVPCTWHIFVFTFQSVALDFWCARPDDRPDLLNLTEEQWRSWSQPGNSSERCQMLDLNYTLPPPVNFQPPKGTEWRDCNRWNFNSNLHGGHTVIEEWQLVCQRREWGNVAEMMFLTGVAIGGLVSGLLSDKFGRKRTLMASLVLQVCIGVLLALSPWFELFMALRFCLGLISVSVVFSGFVLCMELVAGKWRTISGVSYMFPVPIAYILIAGIAYMIRDWRRLQLAITLPAVMLFGLWWVVPESPRWLLAKGRHEEVWEILQQASASNNRPPPPPGLAKILGQTSASDDGERSTGVTDLFRTPYMRRISLLLYVIWFAMYLVYYGLVLNLGNIGGDVYLNTVYSGLVEVPAIALSILFLLKSGRRWPLFATMVGSGVACLLTLVVPIGETFSEPITISLAMIGKFAISQSNAILPVFTAELFPTLVRNLGVGASNMSAGIALMLVPYLWNLEYISRFLPMAVIGACGCIGGIAVLALPETANRPLLDSLDGPKKTSKSPTEQYTKKETT